MTQDRFAKLHQACDAIIEFRLDWLAQNVDFKAPTHSAIAYAAHSRDFQTVVIDPGMRSGKTQYALRGTKFDFPILYRHESLVDRDCDSRVQLLYTDLIRRPSIIAGHRALFVDGAETFARDEIWRIRECAVRCNPDIVLIMMGVPNALA